jgi:hypothetical protein
VCGRCAIKKVSHVLTQSTEGASERFLAVLVSVEGAPVCTLVSKRSYVFARLSEGSPVIASADLFPKGLIFSLFRLQVLLSSLVYEKEKNLRTMMKMHGLTDLPYWIVMYLW